MTRDFGRRGLEFTIVRPKTFIGPERLGVFEILFDWIRDEPPDLHARHAARTATSCSRSRTWSTRSCSRPSAGGRGRDGERRRRPIRNGPLRPAVADRPRRLGVAADAGPGAPGRDRAAHARAAARLAARRMALQDGAPRLLRRRSARRSGCSAGRRGSRTRRRSAGRTTGTSHTARRWRRRA